MADPEKELRRLEKDLDKLSRTDHHSPQTLVDIEAKSARRFEIKARLATKPSEEISWARLAAEARKRQRSALELRWADELKRAMERVREDDETAELFDELAAEEAAGEGA